MASAFETIDFQHDRITRFAFDVDLRLGTGRAPWPAVAWFTPWLLVGRRTGEVDFVWRLASERVVGAPFVIPIDRQSDFPLELRLVFRDGDQPQDAFERSVKSFDDRDAAMFSDCSEPRQDVHRLAPLLLEVLAGELVALVDNQVLGFDLLDVDNPVQCRRYVFGLRSLRSCAT